MTVGKLVAAFVALVGHIPATLHHLALLNTRWVGYLAYNLAWATTPDGRPLAGPPAWTAALMRPHLQMGWWAERSDAGISWAMSHPGAAYAWFMAHPASYGGGSDLGGGVATPAPGPLLASEVAGYTHAVGLVELVLGVVVAAALVWRLRRSTHALAADSAKRRRALGLPVKEMSERAEFKAKWAKKRRDARIDAKITERETQAALKKQIRALGSQGWLDKRGWPVGVLYGTRRLRNLWRGVMVFIPLRYLAEHVQVVGGTGSGKTASQMIRYALHEAKMRLKDRASFLVFDPKPGHEITDKTAGVFARAGWTVGVWDPTKDGSLRYNCLALAPGSLKLRAVLGTWVAAAGIYHPHYAEQCGDILTGMAAYLRVKRIRETRDRDSWRDVSMADVADLLDQTTTETLPGVMAEELQKGRLDPTLNRVVQKLEALASNKQSREAVFRSVRDALACLDQDTVRASCRGLDWSWAEFVVEPTVLYAAVDMGAAHGLKPLMSTLLSTGVTTLGDLARGKKLPRRVGVWADEFVNMGALEDIEAMAATMRSTDTGLLAMTQGPHDVMDVYGKPGRRLLINILTTVVMGKTPIESLKSYVQPGLDLTIERMMEKGTATIIRSGDTPIKVHVVFWFSSLWTRLRVARAMLHTTKGSILRAQRTAAAAAVSVDTTAVVDAPPVVSAGIADPDAPLPAIPFAPGLSGGARVGSPSAEAWIDDEPPEAGSADAPGPRTPAIDEKGGTHDGQTERLRAPTSAGQPTQATSVGTRARDINLDW